MDALFNKIVAHVPAPDVDADAPFAMLAVTVERDPYLGRLLTGRVQTGKARPNMPIRALDRDGNVIETRGEAMSREWHLKRDRRLRRAVLPEG